MKLFGGSLFAALLPSTIISTSLALLAWGIARAARLTSAAQLMAAGLVLFIPEFMLGSVRTDTPINYALWVGLALLCFGEGMRRRPPLLVLAGAFTGLAWLTRIDGILLIPALVVAIGVWWQFGGAAHPLALGGDDVPGHRRSYGALALAQFAGFIWPCLDAIGFAADHFF